MKKLVLLLLAFVAFNLLLSAQDNYVAGKLFYTELGGPGVIMSANYDMRFDSNSRLGFGFRVGAGFGTVEEYVSHPHFYTSRTRTYYSIPVGLNYVFGTPNSAKTFEVGVGLSLLTLKVSLYTYNSYRNNDDNAGNAIGFLTFMYRSMPVDGGFSWRIGLTPIIGTGGDLYPMGAIGIGYVF